MMLTELEELELCIIEDQPMTLIFESMKLLKSNVSPDVLKFDANNLTSSDK